MKEAISRQEIVLLCLAILIGAGLRFYHSDQIAIEHFDEGVYASSLWYDADFQSTYPARELYAPPLLPQLIRLCSFVATDSIAAFLPSLITGILMILVMWLMARSFFGMTAGVFSAFIVALSDFHIMYSRMALTDVPVLFWICLSVLLAVLGINARSHVRMVLAGIVCGLAWWTKYSGWLPLAIVISGSYFWWMRQARSQITFVRLSLLLTTMTATAFLVWSPWLWMLQSSGGYSAVAANHRAYVSGFTSWQEHLTHQLTYHFTLDSWLGAASVGLGLLTAGFRRWIMVKRSTWNTTAPSETGAQYPSESVLIRFIIASLSLCVVSLSISSFVLLCCVAMGGLAGIFLWPVLPDLYRRRTNNDLSAVDEHAHPFTQSDLQAAPLVDPGLASCVTLAWLAGMLVATPMYHPFPRLSLPLLAAIWLAASGGISWWIEACLNVARRGKQSSSQGVSSNLGLRRMITAMAIGAVTLSLYSLSNSSGLSWVQGQKIWSSRTSLRNSSWAIAELCLLDASGQLEEEQLSEQPKNAIVTPDSVDITSAVQPKLDSFDFAQPLTDSNPPQCVIYAFGEPAVLHHARQAGHTVAPVQDLAFKNAAWKGTPLPTYLVIGPNALRTPGFMNSWAIEQDRFEHVADVPFHPSPIVMLNLFRVPWIRQHPECLEQRLEVYRLVSSE